MNLVSPIRRGAPRFGAQAGRIVPQSRIAGPMPWVIAIMVALTVMATAAGLALNNLASNARSEITGGLTVQIVEGGPAARARQTQAALAFFAAREDIAEVRQVPEAELAELLEPWLGGGVEADDAVPIPALIDVRMNVPLTRETLSTLRAELAAIVPSARVDAQSGWLAPVFEAIRSLQFLALGLVVLLATTSVAAVWLSARSALGSNRETIEVVHHLGGSDRQIARLFQRSIALDAMLGGLAGLLLGLAAILVLGRQFGALGSGLVAGGGLRILDWALIAAVPLVGVVLALLTARYTVLANLKRMP